MSGEKKQGLATRLHERLEFVAGMLHIALSHPGSSNPDACQTASCPRTNDILHEAAPHLAAMDLAEERLARLEEAARKYMFYARHADGCRKALTEREWLCTPSGQDGKPWVCACGFDELTELLKGDER